MLTTVIICLVAILMVGLLCHTHYYTLKKLQLQSKEVARVVVEDVVNRSEDADRIKDPIAALMKCKQAHASLLTALGIAGGADELVRLSGGLDINGIEDAILDQIKELKCVLYKSGKSEQQKQRGDATLEKKITQSTCPARRKSGTW